MKILICSLSLAFLFGLVPLQLWAEDGISVGVQLPQFYHFDVAKDGGKLQSNGVQGLLLNVTLPKLGTLGFESYDVGLKNNGTAKLSLMLINYVYLLPVPFVDLGVGVGVGTANLKGGTYASEYQRATAAQWLLQLSVPLSPGLAITYSYHSVTARPKYVSQDIYLEGSGSMSSLGLAFGF